MTVRSPRPVPGVGSRLPRLAALLLMLPCALPVAGQIRDVVTVTSPNGEIEFRLAMAFPQTKEVTLDFPAYQVDFHGRPLIDTSFIAFGLYSQVPLGGKLGLVRADHRSVDETYSMPLGKTREVRDHYNTVFAEYLQNGTQGRRLNIEVRVYDDGVAFRFIIPQTILTDDVRLEGETTQFHFAKDGDAYPLILEDYGSNYEDEYRRVTLSGIHSSEVIGLPFLVEQPGVGWVAVTEADIENYPGSYLTHEEGGGTTFSTDLSPLLDGSDLAAHVRAPVTTPWRVLLIGDTPAGLIESNMVTSLNPPAAAGDTSWIKAGKYLVASERNTAAINRAVDFAAEQGLEYVLIDAGWAAEGEGVADDIVHSISAVDLPGIAARAAQKGVGIWLWAHWASVDGQMDEAFPLFEQWGIQGVTIDWLNRDDQWMTSWYRKVAEAAAAHHLMLDFHGSFKPDGLRRTFPNVLTREAVLGAEYAKWGGRANPRHDVMLAFTRMLAGPLDYGPGSFAQVPREEFEASESEPKSLGTRAHQLALYAVLESPLMGITGAIESYAATEKDRRDFQFIKDVPTTWDESRALNGEVGEYVTVARRSGADSFLGAITGDHARQIEVPLEFLGTGNWTAELYLDGEDAAENPKSTRVESRAVNAGQSLTLDLAPGGGAAIRFRRN